MSETNYPFQERGTLRIKRTNTLPKWLNKPTHDMGLNKPTHGIRIYFELTNALYKWGKLVKTRYKGGDSWATSEIRG